MVFLRPAVRLFAGALWAVWSVALVAWLTLHWGILPRLDDWRPQIERHVGQALGVPLSIGRIEVRSSGWVPSFSLSDVRLLDTQGRVALALGRVSAALSPSSIWALEPRFAQLHLEGVALDLRRSADGRLHVAGLDLDAARTDNAWLDWFLRQHEFVIRHGSLRWTDETRGAPPLVLSDVDLVLRNGARRHALRLDATPPPDWGQRLALRGEFRQPLAARPSELRRWQGELYAMLPQVDLSRLGRHLSLPFALQEGRGALRSWTRWDGGRPVALTADLALTRVVAQLAPDLPPLALSELRGRIQGRQDARSLRLEVEQLDFLSDDGHRWAPGALQLDLQRAQGADDAWSGQAWAGGELRLDRLSLAPLARLAARLPLPPASHAALASLDPQGEVTGLSLAWNGPPRQPQRYRLGARISDLALASGAPGPASADVPQTAGRPGLRGATLDLQASERGGQATLAIERGALVFPGVFEDPVLALDRARAELVWAVAAGAEGAPPAVVLQVQDAQAANADAALQFDGRWSTGAGSGLGAGRYLPGQLSLQGRLLRGDATRVARYLPLGLPVSARQYVASAFSAGRITGGEFKVDGDLWRFPFVDGGPGVFHIRAQVQQTHYAFVPSEPGWPSPWPALAAVRGTLEFDRGAMRIRDAQAELAGVALQAVNGGIEDLAGQRLLKLQGRADGPLADMLRFVRGTPVDGWTGGALAQAQASGAAAMTLALEIPLADPAQARVRGSVQLAGNGLRLQPDLPWLNQLQGRVEFSERGLTLPPLQARALGGALSLSGGSQADGSLRFKAEGQASAEGLLRPGELPVLAPLAGAASPRLRGQTAYSLQIELREGRTQWQLDSTLAGLALELPAPLDKPAAASWPLRLQLRSSKGTGSAAAGERLQLDLGDRLHLQLEGAALALPSRAALGVGVAAPALPSTGLAATLTLPALDLDAWRALAPAWPGGTPGLPSGALRLTLQANDLRLDGRRLQDVALTLQRRAEGPNSVWRAEGSARQGEGWIEWQPAADPQSAPRLRARLLRLDIPQVEDAAPAAESAESAASASPPSMSVIVDELRWRGRALGRLELEAQNRAAAAAPGARVWQLERLRLSKPDASLSATGGWASGQRSTLAFELALADGGAFFERMGAGKAMQGAPGRIHGELSWPGPPTAARLAAMRGQAQVELRNGRFLDAEPGVARLFGILSLQALPRRLLLDFSDVFERGTSFDRIEGQIALADGQARTSNLRVLGVQAAVLVEGRADLLLQTQDLVVYVVPELGTAGASLAWAAVNPALGLGAFVAQWLLNKPVSAAATREFHVTGPWQEPLIERVQRSDRADLAARGDRANDASRRAAATDAPPAAAASTARPP